MGGKVSGGSPEGETWPDVGFDGDDATEPDLSRGVPLAILPPWGLVNVNCWRRGVVGLVRD